VRNELSALACPLEVGVHAFQSYEYLIKRGRIDVFPEMLKAIYSAMRREKLLATSGMPAFRELDQQFRQQSPEVQKQT